MSDHFVTEFGHRIDFVPGYFERNSFYAHFAKHNWQGRKPYECDAQAGKPLGYYMVAKDWVLFSALVSFLSRLGLLKKWHSGIDLGGAEGTVIRLFKAAGLLDCATNLDIFDFSRVAPDAYFTEFLHRTAAPDWANSATHPVTDAINWAKVHLDYLPMTAPLEGLVVDFPVKPEAETVVANIYDAHGCYDLIVSNALLEFVDLDRALPKIRSLIAPGGTFVGNLNLCWCPVVPNGLVGDFPYLFQRLTLNDARRYFEGHRPEQLFNLEARYSYFHEGKQRPALSDWMEAFKRNGLKVAGFELVSPIRAKRYGDPPKQLLKKPWFNPNEVLRDAHHINQSVTIDDLTATALRVALV